MRNVDPEKAVAIQVDASQRELAAAPVQEGKLIAFARKLLTDTKKRLANVEGKMLAVTFVVRKSHIHIYSRSFTVESDA